MALSRKSQLHAIKGILDRVIGRFGPNGFRVIKAGLEQYKKSRHSLLNDSLSTFVKDLTHLKPIIKSELDQEVILQLGRFLDESDQERFE